MKLKSDYVHTFVWQHNALRGAVRFAKQIMRQVAAARTATTNAVALAHSVLYLLDQLEEALQERYDDEDAFAEGEE